MGENPEDDLIEARVGAALRARDETLAVAETCTGGGVASLLTDVPGASDYFDRGYVAYSYDALRTSLGVDREALDEYGVVSEPVTGQLARRARDLAGATWSVSTTGIAGPGGGTADKPVGTAYVGVAYAGSWGSEASTTTVERHAFDGNRERIRALVARAALDLLVASVESIEEE